MATCGAHKKLKSGGELNCDLDSNHLNLLRFHYDKLEDVEWVSNHVPQSVPYSPTGPIKKVPVEN